MTADNMWLCWWVLSFVCCSVSYRGGVVFAVARFNDFAIYTSCTQRPRARRGKKDHQCKCAKWNTYRQLETLLKGKDRGRDLARSQEYHRNTYALQIMNSFAYCKKIVRPQSRAWTNTCRGCCTLRESCQVHDAAIFDLFGKRFVVKHDETFGACNKRT